MVEDNAQKDRDDVCFMFSWEADANMSIDVRLTSFSGFPSCAPAFCRGTGIPGLY